MGKVDSDAERREGTNAAVGIKSKLPVGASFAVDLLLWACRPYGKRI